MIPYAEKFVGDYLREHADIEAITGGRRVSGATPESTDAPWIRLTQLDARNAPDSRLEHLVEFYLQLDCYAGADGGQPEASLLARTAREVLHEMPDDDFEDVVVTQVRFAGMARIPDTQVDDPHRERFVLSALVRAHAVSP